MNAPMDVADSRHSSAVAAGQVAALWRWVRWGAAAFCFVQFAVYVPGAGIRVPWPLLPLGAAIALLLALVNIGALVQEHRQPRTAGTATASTGAASTVASRTGASRTGASHTGASRTGASRTAVGAVARRDLVLLAVDTAIVITVVQLFAFEPTSAVWVLLVVPVLEAGLVGRLRWALIVWTVAVAALLFRELLAVHLHHLPAASPTEALSVLGFRVGMLLLVATVVGFQANVAHHHLMQLHHTQDQLSHEAGHDHLTGLPTRRLFLDRAGRALRHAQHHGDTGSISLLFIDADHFKTLNDTHGHATGDEILQQIAARLTAFLGPDDTAARLGGDEFAVLLQRPADAKPPTDVHALAAALRTALAEPYTITGHGTVPMSCSVGAAADRHGDTLSTLLRHADQAMYTDKTHTAQPQPLAPSPRTSTAPPPD